MRYRIVIRKQALKEIGRMPAKINEQIVSAIENLKDNPRPSGCKKLKGEREIMWRIRVGDYRVLYTIEDAIKIVEVRKVGHRKNIYS